MAKPLRNLPGTSTLRLPSAEQPRPSYAHLNSRQLRAELEGRTLSIQSTVESLKAELSTVTGLNLTGAEVSAAPKPDNTLRNVGIAVAGGLALGVLAGLRSRSKRKPAPEGDLDLVRVRLATLLDDAAGRVAKGTSAEEALRATLRKTPVVYGPSSEAAVAGNQSKSSIRKVVDLAVKSAGGFVLNVVMDELQEAFTGKRPGAKSA